MAHNLKTTYTKDLHYHLSQIRHSAINASAMLELSGATDWEHSKDLHINLQNVIRIAESAMKNSYGELDLPEYESKAK